MTLYEQIEELIKAGDEFGKIAKNAVKSYDETKKGYYLYVADNAVKEYKKVQDKYLRLIEKLKENE